jgi:hypothetical protein
MRPIAVAILTISQLTLVPFVNQLSTNASVNSAVAVDQSQQNQNVTVIYKRDGAGLVIDSGSSIAQIGS